MVFLFKKTPCSDFISEFSKRQPSMQKFLNDLEGSAVQLDKMNKGAKISSVAGSSVGASGGVLSIVGLALSPVTAGASLALTITGTALGILSGVNSLVTTATEIGVNRKHQKEASETFQSFMEDVKSVQHCLNKVISQAVINIEASDIDVAVGVGKVLFKAGAIGKGIDSVVDTTSDSMLLTNNVASLSNTGTKLITSAGKVGAEKGKALCHAPMAAIGMPKAAVKTLSKAARVGFIANALFIGMNIFFICKDSITLYKGSEAEVSQFIRARSELWSSEIDAWQKICDSLREGLLTSEKHQAVLDKPFYLHSS